MKVHTQLVRLIHNFAFATIVLISLAATGLAGMLPAASSLTPATVAAATQTYTTCILNGSSGDNEWQCPSNTPANEQLIITPTTALTGYGENFEAAVVPSVTTPAIVNGNVVATNTITWTPINVIIEFYYATSDTSSCDYTTDPSLNTTYQGPYTNGGGNPNPSTSNGSNTQPCLELSFSDATDWTACNTSEYPATAGYGQDCSTVAADIVHKYATDGTYDPSIVVQWQAKEAYTIYNQIPTVLTYQTLQLTSANYQTYAPVNWTATYTEDQTNDFTNEWVTSWSQPYQNQVVYWIGDLPDGIGSVTTGYISDSGNAADSGGYPGGWETGVNSNNPNGPDDVQQGLDGTGGTNACNAASANESWEGWWYDEAGEGYASDYPWGIRDGAGYGCTWLDGDDTQFVSWDVSNFNVGATYNTWNGSQYGAYLSSYPITSYVTDTTPYTYPDSYHTSEEYTEPAFWYEPETGTYNYYTIIDHNINTYEPPATAGINPACSPTPTVQSCYDVPPPYYTDTTTDFTQTSLTYTTVLNETPVVYSDYTQWLTYEVGGYTYYDFDPYSANEAYVSGTYRLSWAASCYTDVNYQDRDEVAGADYTSTLFDGATWYYAVCPGGNNASATWNEYSACCYYTVYDAVAEPGAFWYYNINTFSYDYWGIDYNWFTYATPYTWTDTYQALTVNDWPLQYQFNNYNLPSGQPLHVEQSEGSNS